MANKKSNFAVGAVIAAVAGYITGILTAPKSGIGTRKDIRKTATRVRTDGEKQLKALHSELNDLIDQAETKIKSSKSKADTQLKKAVEGAKKSKQKTRMLLSALHDGDAEDPDLKKMINEAKKAKSNLEKFFKK